MANAATRKRWIVLLLVASCLAGGILLLTWTPQEYQILRSPAQLDSLIELNLERFQVEDQRVRTTSIRLDTTEVRRIYNLRLPPHISKTQWHYELDKLVRPYGVSTPARVIFPEQDMRIHLAYRENILRTLHIRSDPSGDTGEGTPGG